MDTFSKQACLVLATLEVLRFRLFHDAALPTALVVMTAVCEVASLLGSGGNGGFDLDAAESEVWRHLALGIRRPLQPLRPPSRSKG